MDVPDRKVIRDAGFGKRLTDECNRNPNVPPPNYGRLGWIQEQMDKRFGDKITIETVRKWLGGEVKPKHDRIVRLAQLLEVTETWLAFGIDPDITPRDRRTQSTESDASVMLVAGLVKLAGGIPAFPTEDDERAKRDSIDLYAIIKGAQYAMHITLGSNHDGLIKFSVPATYEMVMQIGMIQLSEFCVRLIDIPDEVIVTGKRQGGSVEVTMSADDLDAREIKSFRQRL